MTTNISYKRHGLPNYHGQKKGWKLMEFIVSNATFATPLKGSPNGTCKLDNLQSMKACKRAKKYIEKGPKGGYKILGLILLSCKKSSIVCSTQERDDDTTNGIRT
jgi:hypothetical protein